ncbi:MAG TPA: DUF6364 family protein [Mucilaginibacter sp.]|jgi:hypothetical protein
MAHSKLTLSMEPEFIEMAKSYASENNTSVSKLFKNYIKDVSKKKPQKDSVLEKFKDNPIHPDILALTGILKGKYPEGTTYDDMRYEYFKERYDL